MDVWSVASSSLIMRLPPRKLNQFHISNSHPRRATGKAADDATAGGLRVFLVSDLHTEHTDNMSWVKSLSTTRKKMPTNFNNKDVLIVAGDVSETLHNFVSTMSLLKDSFHHVFFVPGNHDLWCRRETQPPSSSSSSSSSLHSLEKLEKLTCTCQSLGIDTKPKMIDGLGIIPLFSWYHESFDKEEDITGFSIPSLDRVIHFLSPSKNFKIFDDSACVVF